MHASSDSDLSYEHIREAEENYERYHRLLQDERDVDWALVVLFYCAMHLVQAHAVRHARKLRNVDGIPADHERRNAYVHRLLPELYEDYMLLQSASKDARYKRVKRSRNGVELLHDRLFETVRSRLAKRNIQWEVDNA